MKHLSVLILFFLISGCQPSYIHFDQRFDGRGKYIEGVPFYPQEENYCGPASLAGVLGFWGDVVSQEEVGREIYSPKIKGTINVDMANYARKRGFHSEYFRGDLKRVIDEIDRGYPLILYLHMGPSLLPQRHYIVAVGYDDAKRAVIAYSGREKDLLIPYDELLRYWERAGYWSLLVSPGKR